MQRTLLTLLAATLVATVVHAQTGALALSLDDAVAHALEQNGASQTADAVASLRHQTQLTRLGAFGPDVTLSTAATRTLGRSFSQQEGGIVRGSNDLAGGSLDAELELFSGLSDVAGVLVANKQAAAADRWQERTRQQIALAVTQQFVALGQGQTLVKVRQTQLDAQKELYAVVERMVALGRRPETDLFEQKANEAEARLAQVDAVQSVRRSRSELRRILQIPPEQAVRFIPLEPPNAAFGAIDLDALVRSAREKRDDIRALQAEVSAARHGILGAQSGFWPRLSLRAGYGTNWSSQDLKAIPGTGTSPRLITVTPDDGGSPATFAVPGSGSDASFSLTPLPEQLLSRHGGSVALVMSLPLFEGLDTWQRLQEARTNLTVAEVQLEQQKHAAQAEVEQAAIDAEAAEQRIQATHARQIAAEAARDGARRRYELGRGTLLEVTQAQSRFAEAEAAHVRARYASLLARKTLGYRVGDGEEALGTPAALPPTAIGDTQ